MRKGRFLNQKLGKRTSRRMNLEKTRLQDSHARSRASAANLRLPKKGVSREQPPKSGQG